LRKAYMKKIPWVILFVIVAVLFLLAVTHEPPPPALSGLFI